MSVLDLARPELLQLKAYSSARMEAGAAAVMLNANEAAQSFAEARFGEHLNRYPEPQPTALLLALAQRYGVRAEQIFVGRGSDEAIDLLVRAFCRAGVDRILICPPTFGMYRVCAGVQNAAVVEVPLDASADFAADFEAIEAAVDDRVKVVFLCTPNNPTGGVLPRDRVLDLLERLRGRALVVVDEAYIEFSNESSLAAELDRFEHLAVLRTMSKAFGLAGARIGALLAAPAVITLMRRIMAAYPVPQPCADAALSALAAGDQVDAWIGSTRQERERLSSALRQHAEVLKVWPSQANFLSFRVRDAQSTLRRLASHGVIVRDVSHYLGLAECLRVSIGSTEDNDRFLSALSDTGAGP